MENKKNRITIIVKRFAFVPKVMAVRFLVSTYKNGLIKFSIKYPMIHSDNIFLTKEGDTLSFNVVSKDGCEYIIEDIVNETLEKKAFVEIEN